MWTDPQNTNNFQPHHGWGWNLQNLVFTDWQFTNMFLFIFSQTPFWPIFPHGTPFPSCPPHQWVSFVDKHRCSIPYTSWLIARCLQIGSQMVLETCGMFFFHRHLAADNSNLTAKLAESFRRLSIHKIFSVPLSSFWGTPTEHLNFSTTHDISLAQ